MQKSLKPLARSLRHNATNAERRLWQGLRREQVAGFRFRRQVVLAGIIADFACFDARLVVEVDGATHSTDQEIARDAARSAALAAQGFDILRFTNDDVYRNLSGVLETVRLKLMELRLSTSLRFEFGATSALEFTRRSLRRVSSPFLGED